MTPPPIDEYAIAERVEPWLFDRLLAAGWRHFDTVFFRYSRSEAEEGHYLSVQPLRLELARYSPTKSQRRCLRRNADLTISIAPACITPESAAMFDAHKRRFRSNVPGRLEDFLGETPGSVVPCLAFTVAREGVPVAVSYLDLGRESVSSVYGVFDPAEAARGLGIFTMLAEIQWAARAGFRFHYSGYATREPSHYDYKKRFRNLSTYDWNSGEWRDLAG